MWRIGEILRDKGLIDEAQIREATEVAGGTERSLAKVLIERGYVSERDVVAALAEQVGLEFVNLANVDVDPRAATLISESIARRYGVLPVAFADGGLVVAMSDPGNVVALDDIRAITGHEVRPVVAARDDVAAAIGRYNRMSDEIESLADDIGDDETPDLDALHVVTDDAPVVKFVNLLLRQAAQDGASDIHIEPGERDLRVRYRIDGVLHEQMRAQKSIQAGVISRLKIMADVDIAERRMPQDGRISLSVDGRAIDVRFSTLPTVHGEKVVMRILDKSSVMLELEDLGFSEHNHKRFEESYRRPYGMILVTGPTGSGKSTTLYATLNVLNEPAVNIVTTEDPVEYRLPGISQVQVHPKVGLTFATALRSILRQDPDIVLVGEMRDHETAQMGIEAALTGHLVLSTLHTNDAASAVTRLVEMGVEPFLVGSAVDCVLAQRLARQVCASCVDMVRHPPEILQAAGFSADIVDDRPELPYARGCVACSKTGYKGRTAIHEVMPVTEELERLCVAQASSDEIKRTAVEQGMATLRDDGLEKVLSGRTTLEEIGRVVV